MNGTTVGTNKLTLVSKRSKPKSTKKTSSFVKSKKFIQVALGFLVFAIIGGGIIAYERVYADAIYPKIMVAGINIGGKTPQEAKALIQEKADELNKQGPEITYNDQTLKPKLDEMGVTFNIDEIINQAYNYGREGSLRQMIIENYHILARGHQTEISPKIDEEKFNTYLSQLAQVVEKEPVNANLSISNGVINLSPSEIGRGLDKDKLKKDLTDLINSGQTSGKIVMNTSDLEPKIKEEQTNSARAQAEKYLAAAPISVTFEGSTWTADRSEIGSWIKFSESGNQLNASVSPSGFVKWIAEQVEIPVKDKEIQDGTGTVLSEGQDGRQADTDLLSAQIRDALAATTPSTFALVTSIVPRGQTIIYPHAQPGRYTGRYIDINLSEQTLYAFEGANLVNQFLVSTGKRGYATPTGEFNIWGKTPSQLMDGPDYYLPNVPWISWVVGENAIHGTYWHNNFGTPMSHGCINASIPDAEWVYNFVDIGTPVYIHY